MCDDNCTATLDKHNVVLTKNNTTIWTRNKDPVTKLWLLPLDTTDEHQMNNLYTINSFKQKVEYLHACTGYPPKNSWLSAVNKNYYNSWPITNTKNNEKEIRGIF